MLEVPQMDFDILTKAITPDANNKHSRRELLKSSCLTIIYLRDPDG